MQHQHHPLLLLQVHQAVQQQSQVHQAVQLLPEVLLTVHQAVSMALHMWRTQPSQLPCSLLACVAQGQASVVARQLQSKHLW